MRILSPSERHSLGLVSDVPVELNANYFPICLRAFTQRNGKKLLDCENSGVDNLITSVARHLNCQSLTKEVRSKSGDYTYYNRQIIDFSYRTLAEEGSILRNSYRAEYTMFPVDNLLFDNDLRKFNITPLPGRLYFQTNIMLRSGGYPNSGSAGSLYLEEPDYLRHLDDEQRKQWDRVRRREERHGRVLIEEENEEPSKPWRGPIADIEELTNSRVMSQRVFGSSQINAEYVLETPLDFTPGFVQETVNVFKRRWNKITRTAKKFCDLVAGSPLEESSLQEPAAPPAKTAKKRSSKEDQAPAEVIKDFPQGLPPLKGPDTSWHRCDEPWFVQSVLLARLIGGRYWQYALGYLESKIGRSV